MAVSEQMIEKARVRRIWRPARLLLLFVAMAMLGIGLVVGSLALIHERQVGRIMTGVSAAGVDLAGLTADEARAALTARLAGLSAGSVTVRTSIGSTAIAFADVGRAPDLDAMVAAAAARGRGGSWLDEVIAGFRLERVPEAIPLMLGYDHDRAVVALRGFADRMALGAVDATIVRGPATFTVTPSVDGRTVDVDGAIAALDAAMRDPATRAGAIVTAATAAVAPALSSDEARVATGTADRMVADLKIASGKKTWNLPSSTIRSWISFGPVDGRIGPILDRSRLPAWLSPIRKSVARPVRDAEFLRDKRGRIVGSMADRAGAALDVQKTGNAIVRALQARAAGGAAADVKLAMTTIAPKVTAAQAAKTAPLMVLVGGWTTHYVSAAHNGFSANISIPTWTLNGTVVQPGAVFDFWAGLGEVSLRTGYKLGGAIVNGHSVEGKALAGGICSASTTLFNAALRGGFEILERSPHWYYISRYPLGLDATVSGAQTMRFRNDTAYPILIRGFASPGFVRYEIWSVPNGRSVSLSAPLVSNVVSGSDSTVLASDLAKGTSERTEWPVDGKDVVVTRVVRDAGGRVIHRDTFVSHYHRMIGILRIGTR